MQVTPRLDAGGVERTTLDVAKAVIAAGGRAVVVSEGGRLEGELLAMGAELVRLPVASKNPLTLLANARALKAMIAERQVSLVHARSRAPAFSALAAARATNTPSVATYAGVYNSTTPWKRWYNGVMARADLVIANSDFTRAHVLAMHRTDPAKVIAIPRGVDLAAFDPAAVSADRVEALRHAWGIGERDTRPVILLAGRLTRWKGQALAVQAARRLNARGVSDFILVLAGDDQGRDAYRMELETAIAGAALGDCVRIVGHCADMPAAYLAADVAIAPSLRPEAFGRTAVEPQAMGRPVIAADHGAARETVLPGETGWLVPPGDPQAWTDAIEAALAAGPHAWTRMGQEGIAQVRGRYSVDAMTRATLEAYAALLASRASAAR
ncbi:MAG: glycosyl transferase [Caulobacterales bacterium 32-69-10]|nr:MAG: glycosyl transferase [Caulobacterales bacterium 32-69-10]